jgi:hypothetical protein
VGEKSEEFDVEGEPCAYLAARSGEEIELPLLAIDFSRAGEPHSGMHIVDRNLLNDH